MSMASGAGAAVAAGEILTFIEKKMNENKDKPEILKVLRSLRKKVNEIKKAGEGGWY